MNPISCYEEEANELIRKINEVIFDNTPNAHTARELLKESIVFSEALVGDKKTPPTTMRKLGYLTRTLLDKVYSSFSKGAVEFKEGYHSVPTITEAQKVSSSNNLQEFLKVERRKTKESLDRIYNSSESERIYRQIYGGNS